MEGKEGNKGKYLFSTVGWHFVLDESLKVVDKLESGMSADDLSEMSIGLKTEKEKEICNRLGLVVFPKDHHDLESMRKVLENTEEQTDWKASREKSISAARLSVKRAFSKDNLIIHCVNNVEEIEKAANTQVRRIREWFSLYLPEIERSINSNEMFVDEILNTRSMSQADIFKKAGINESMGAEFDQNDLEEIYLVAEQSRSLYELRTKHIEYLEQLEKKYCPHMQKIGGTMTVAKLINIAGSLRKLAMLPSSTIQILGAEKALFRHLKTRAKPPKYGVIFKHPDIQRAKNQGKAARNLASKLAIAAKQDYFSKDHGKEEKR